MLLLFPPVIFHSEKIVGILPVKWICYHQNRSSSSAETQREKKEEDDLDFGTGQQQQAGLSAHPKRMAEELRYIKPQKREEGKRRNGWMESNYCFWLFLQCLMSSFFRLLAQGRGKKKGKKRLYRSYKDWPDFISTSSFLYLVSFCSWPQRPNKREIR